MALLFRGSRRLFMPSTVLRDKLNVKNALSEVKMMSKTNFSSTSKLNEIFTIQDEKDYNERVLKSTKPVIVDFYATWCGPCKTLGPRLETVIGSKANSVDLAKIDVDEHESLATKYQVSQIPSVFALKNGKVIDQFIGVKDEDQLRAFVGKLIDE